MAKKKAAGDDDFFAELAEKTNGSVLNNIDSVSYFVDTGNLALNYICSGKFIGGGVPGGKLTEIYGPSSSSKSLIGNNILFGCQKLGGIPVLLDCENSANKEFIQNASHCDLKRVVRHTPETLEKVFAKMHEVVDYIRAKKGPDIPIVILYDSIGVSPCERELREIDLPENYSQADFKRIVGAKEQPGERAKICSKELRKLNSAMEKKSFTVVILNQIRSKVGVVYGNPETTAGGGNALPFYASCRIRPQTQVKIEEKLSAKKKKILGISLRFRNVKNKTHRPFIESDGIQLLFDRGINPLGGLLSCLAEEGRVEKAGNGRFAVKEPWAGGEKVVFSGSFDSNNSVPPDVLLKCPTLIDAATTEEVQEYLRPFQSALDFKIEGDVVATQVTEGDEEDEVSDSIDKLLSGEAEEDE